MAGLSVANDLGTGTLRSAGPMRRTTDIFAESRPGSRVSPVEATKARQKRAAWESGLGRGEEKEKGEEGGNREIRSRQRTVSPK